MLDDGEPADPHIDHTHTDTHSPLESEQPAPDQSQSTVLTPIDDQPPPSNDQLQQDTPPPPSDQSQQDTPPSDQLKQDTPPPSDQSQQGTSPPPSDQSQQDTPPSDQLKQDTPPPSDQSQHGTTPIDQSQQGTPPPPSDQSQQGTPPPPTNQWQEVPLRDTDPSSFTQEPLKNEPVDNVHVCILIVVCMLLYCTVHSITLKSQIPPAIL